MVLSVDPVFGVCVCMYVCVYVCVCVCVCVKRHWHRELGVVSRQLMDDSPGYWIQRSDFSCNVSTVCVCVCASVCICVCMWKRERERKRASSCHTTLLEEEERKTPHPSTSSKVSEFQPYFVSVNKFLERRFKTFRAKEHRWEMPATEFCHRC